MRVQVPPSAPMIKIRKIKPEELGEVFGITESCFPDRWPESYFKKLLQNYPHDFFVAEIENKIVGYVLGYLKPDGTGWIKAVAVKPDFQGQGIGTQIMDFIIARIKEAETGTVGLHSRKNNQKSTSFYQKMGFKIAETIPEYYPNGDAAYGMEKRL